MTTKRIGKPFGACHQGTLATCSRYPYREIVMAAKSTAWAAFPHASKSFDYAGDKLKTSWAALHAGDCEPYPDTKRAAALLKSLAKPPKDLSAAKLAETLQEAWRAFHRGDFHQAYTLGETLGPLGASVAVKAMGIHANYLVKDEAERLRRFEQATELADKAVAALPDEVNSHFRRAFALGRYSQGISIGKALTMGLAGKVKASLDQTIELAPKHAEAHTAMAIFHAEIINKVGAMLGGLTYGAKASAAETHIKTAIKLTPNSPIAHIEHANMLLLLHGAKQEDAAAAAFEKAAKLKPLDAMERLDQEYAKEQLE
jgi:tetratricopeptide (TPR) repeat protein